MRDYSNRIIELEPEELIARATEDPFWPMPAPFLRAMVESEIEDSGSPARLSSVSATALLGACTRCTILRRHIPYTESIADIWTRWRGSMYHMLMQQNASPGTITELRMEAQVPGLDPGDVLTGQPDIIYPYVEKYDGAVLVDLKNPGKRVPKWDRVWDDHKLQLNIYRWMVNHVTDIPKPEQLEAVVHKGGIVRAIEDVVPFLRELDFKSVGIWYADPDEVKPLEVRETIQVETKPGAKYATKPQKVPVVMSDEEIEKVIVPKYDALRTALDEYAATGKLPPYPPGQDPTPAAFWPHRYSPVSGECLRQYYVEGN